VQITVDNRFPTRKSDGKVAFAQPGDQELWPLVLEKAYAIYRGGYDKINGGDTGQAELQAFTGKPSTRLDPKTTSFDQLYAEYSKGDAVNIGIPAHDPKNPLYKDLNPPLAGPHVYYVTAMDPINKTITFRNPWSYSLESTIPWDQYQKVSDNIIVNPIDHNYP
jgi:hypothetical protein